MSNNDDEMGRIVEEALSDIREIFERVYERGSEQGYEEGCISTEKDYEEDKKNWDEQVLNDPETIFECLENTYKQIYQSPTDFNRLIDFLNVISDGKIGLIKK